MANICTYSIVNINNSTVKSVEILFDPEVDPMIFLLNFQLWTEQNGFKYHWFSDLLESFSLDEINNNKLFYHKISRGFIIDNMPLGYDGKRTVALFINTMIGCANTKIDLSSNIMPELYGYSINGKIDIDSNYLLEGSNKSVNNRAYMKFARLNNKLDSNFDPFSEESRKAAKDINDFIKNANDLDEHYIESIDFKFIKKVKVDINQLKALTEDWH